MKKIIFALMLAVSFMAFTACNDITNGNNGNNGAGTEGNVSVTPAELLKNIPVTTDDLKNMLGSTNINRSAESDSNESPAASDLVPFILKTLISETEGFEFGKNKSLGVIGSFSENAKNEFAKVYGDATDGYLESFAVRNFGTAYVNMEGDKATIFWYMPENQEGTMTFPECSIYINGTYKNGIYESIEIYGEGYSYGNDESGNFKAYPIYEKKYITGNKVISMSAILKESNICNNLVSKIEITSSGITRTTVAYSDELPTQADIDGYHQKIQKWLDTVNN